MNSTKPKTDSDITMKIALSLLTLLLIITSPTYASADSVREAYYRSFQYEQNENFDDAIRALMPIYSSARKNYTLNLRFGWLHYRSGHYNNSLTHYQKALKAAPNSIEPLLGQLLPLLAQERYAEVEQMANKVLRIDSNNYYASLRLIIALRAQEKFELAQNQINQMRVLFPGDIFFIEQSAQLYEQQKDYDNAAALYWDLQTLDPENVWAQRYFNSGESVVVK
jgi:tetratricopeptide (TPR) repeat protein